MQTPTSLYCSCSLDGKTAKDRNTGTDRGGEERGDRTVAGQIRWKWMRKEGPRPARKSLKPQRHGCRQRRLQPDSGRICSPFTHRRHGQTDTATGRGREVVKGEEAVKGHRQADVSTGRRGTTKLCQNIAVPRREGFLPGRRGKTAAVAVEGEEEEGASPRLRGSPLIAIRIR